VQLCDLLGVLDSQWADFSLSLLASETSYREDLHPFNPEAQFKEGDIFRYQKQEEMPHPHHIPCSSLPFGPNFPFSVWQMTDCSPQVFKAK